MLTLLLRLLHVGGGVVWVGGVVVTTFFLFPAARATGPSGAVVMRQLAGVQKFPIFMMVVGLVTVLSGITLFMRNAMGDNNQWGGTTAGITFSVGGLLALIALVIGMVRNRPLAAKMADVGAQLQGAGTPPPANLVAEMTRLQDSLHTASIVVAYLLLGATAAMSVARYL